MNPEGRLSRRADHAMVAFVTCRMTRRIKLRARCLCVLLLFLPLVSSCGDSKSGVELKAVLTPIVPSGSAGDGNTSDYPDAFLSTTQAQVALRSVRLTQKQTTTAATTPTPAASYTFFDVDAANPKTVGLNTQPSIVDETTVHLQEGTYDKVEIELVYYEITVPLCLASASTPVPTPTAIPTPSPTPTATPTASDCENRRVRLYFTDVPKGWNDQTVKARDVLVETTENRGDFGWVSFEKGLPHIENTRPAKPVALPSTVTAPAVLGVTLNPSFEASGAVEQKISVILTLEAAGLFYDETDGSGTTFNALADAENSRDGKGMFLCGSPCQTADFWPVPPAFKATLETETISN